MADVSPTERGQLILVSGLTIAVTLLILVLLLNTVIYSENVATRGIDSNVGDAAEFRQVLDEEIDHILRKADEESWADVNESITFLIDQQRNVSLQRGHIADAEMRDHTKAVRVEGDSKSGETEVANDVEAVMAFNLSLDEDDWNKGDSIEIHGGEEPISANWTAEGIEIRDADDDSLCDETFTGDLTLDFVGERIMIDGGPEDCTDDLWGDTARDFDTGDVSIATSDDTSFEGFEFVGNVSSTDQPESANVRWFATSVELALTYGGPDLAYNSTLVVGEVDR